MLAVLAFQPINNLPTLSPLLALIGWYVYRLSQSQFVFQRNRYWQLKSSELYFFRSDPSASDEVKNNGLKVELTKIQVFHSLVLFTYRIESKTHREIISIDAVDREAFRQFRCMLKSI
jgi:hypothetical protein